MAFTTDQYTALVAAIASGAKFVKYSDKEIEYMPYSQMLQLKREMELDLGIVKCAPRKRTTVYSKGLSLDGRRHIGGGQLIVTINPTSPLYRAATVFIVDTPDPNILLDVGGGVQIYGQYAPGATLTLQVKDTHAAFLANRPVLWPFTVNDVPRQLMGYASDTGIANNTVNGGAGFNTGDYITINFLPNQ